MTIHHDKMAYGKLAATKEDVSEARLAEMLAELECYEESEDETAQKKEAEKKA